MARVSKELLDTAAPGAGECAKPNKEETSNRNPVSSENSPYTVFTLSDLRRLRIILGLGTITSPLTATIYLPLLPLLRHQFSVSAQAINLTLTLYIIFQAISPVIFGPFSDAYGRRPIYLLTLGLYVLGNIGLAANRDNYAVLLVLRAVQSLGASAAYAISFGVVADVCEPNERGRMLGPVSMALNLGACVGPVIGGIVAYANNNHTWVFWSLVIVGIVLFLGVGLLLPETAKRLVGNGGDPARFKWWQVSWVQLIRSHTMSKSSTTGMSSLYGSESVVREPAHKVAIKNLLACFRMIFYPDSFLTLWMHGSFYTVDYSFVAALPDIFKDIYEYNEWQLGLAYLPRGVGIIIGSYVTGKLMDRDYAKTLRELGWTTDRVNPDELVNFPIEKARARNTYLFLFVSTGTIVGYGWAVTQSAHPAVALVLQFIQGFWGTYFYTTYSALMVDTYPQSPSTAAAATSVTRCAMAAAGVAILQPLLDVAGRGWYFTALGLWSGLFGIAAVALLRWKGSVWRSRRSRPTAEIQAARQG
ncbi:unnamed protein product [Clonostachys chloroleuca]|uniref:Major facilitator superfamily (MFS) profile domain-containing protein n=1 Tax=Clonostachys chloroleuca TaxID=1926264 RepID=A0AA35LRQ0_9HYPO|nr:unnamed protein product [Clonostachys chloroleuca]